MPKSKLFNPKDYPVPKQVEAEKITVTGWESLLPVLLALGEANHMPVWARFVKRSTGKLRIMQITFVKPEQMRTGMDVALGAAGAETLFVWDEEKAKPASIPIEGLQSVTLGGDPRHETPSR